MTATDVLTYDLSDDVATLTLDDGKANAISHAAIDGLNTHLDRAQEEASAVLIVGRPGRFSGGFDLAVMKGPPEGVRDLVAAGAELALRLYEFPIPVVVACTGHAVAMGAIVLLAVDVRVGVEGDFKIGLNEVSIGMPLPQFAVELARDRLSRQKLVHAVNHAQLYTPFEAADIGFLDEVARPDDLVAVATGRAQALAASVTQPAFALTRTNLRSSVAADIRRGIADDIARFTVSD